MSGKRKRRLIVFFSLLLTQVTQAKEDSKCKSIKAASGKSQEPKPVSKADPRSKLKSQIKKAVKQSSKNKASDDSQREGESDKEASDKKSQAKKKQRSFAPAKKSSASAQKKVNRTVKRGSDDRNSDKNVVTKKRMASLNASAILAANYEIENYAAKHESSSSSSESSSSEEDVGKRRNDVVPPTMKKEKKDVKMESEEVFLLLFNLFTFRFCSTLLSAHQKCNRPALQRRKRVESQMMPRIC